MCAICGLPKNLCVCSQIDKEVQKIKVKTDRRKFKKVLTVVTGIQDKEQAKELLKILKRKLACGGTMKNEVIELQGDHKNRVKEILLKEGYKEELIEV